MSTAHNFGTDELPTLGFGDRVRRYRISRGMTLQQFAAGTNLSASTIGRYEHDGGDVNDEATKRAAKLVQLRHGVSADWLLYGTEGSPQVTHEKVAVRQVGNVLYPTFGGRRVVEHEHLAPVIHLADRRLAVAA